MSKKGRNKCKQNKKKKTYERKTQLSRILFADIVNFTPLTASMQPKQLVSTLNQLFTRFDQLASVRGFKSVLQEKSNTLSKQFFHLQEHQCLRIKILGDCYYCVSGIPINRPNHADMAVQMGINMIEAIRSVFYTNATNPKGVLLTIHLFLRGIEGSYSLEYFR